MPPLAFAGTKEPSTRYTPFTFRHKVSISASAHHSPRPNPSNVGHHLSPFDCFPLVVREVVREVPEVALRGTRVVCSPVRVNDVHPALRFVDDQGKETRRDAAMSERLVVEMKENPHPQHQHRLHGVFRRKEDTARRSSRYCAVSETIPLNSPTHPVRHDTNTVFSDLEQKSLV